MKPESELQVPEPRARFLTQLCWSAGAGRNELQGRGAWAHRALQGRGAQAHRALQGRGVQAHWALQGMLWG